jgi:uncharacterized glyoxalase superfamily protein PhnB
MARAKNFMPEGMHTITPHLVVKNAAQAIEFYKKAFGATETNRMPGPGGIVMHAALKIGDSKFFVNDPMGESTAPPRGDAPYSIHLYVQDADKIYNQAIAAGAKSEMPLEDQFWGDRYGRIVDPYGHTWAIATHIEDLSPAEMEERSKQFMAQQRH